MKQFFLLFCLLYGTCCYAEERVANQIELERIDINHIDALYGLHGVRQGSKDNHYVNVPPAGAVTTEKER